MSIITQQRLVDKDTYRCDGTNCLEICDQYTMAQNACGWLTIVLNAEQNTVINPKVENLKFCSYKCVALWAGNRHATQLNEGN